MADDTAIKKPGTKTDYTPEQKEQFARCMLDPFYFIDNFVRIQHPMQGAVPFKLWPYQVNLLRAFHENRFSIALTARQMGKTATASVFLLWKAMFTANTTILIVGNNLAAAQEILERAKFAYENLPDQFRMAVTEYNKRSITFSNGSRMVVRATTPNAGRGLSVSLLYCDEFAFVLPNQAGPFWTAIQPTLSTGGGCIITSTPKSDTDQFAQIWRKACENTDEFGNRNATGRGKNDFFAIKIPWHEHPERDEEWAKPFRESLGEAKFEQEMNCCAADTVVQLTNGVREFEATMGDLFNLLKMAA